MVDYLGPSGSRSVYPSVCSPESSPKSLLAFSGDSVSSVERGLNACVVEELTCWLTEL